MSISSYTLLSESEWNQKTDQLDSFARSCCLCPRKCGVNRFNGETGFCKAPGEIIVSRIFPHFGEEPPISGKNGSGTIFFSCCTLKCCFCQNFQISHESLGEPISVSELAKKMLWLQSKGCHNINLVTPSHFLPWIIRSLKEAFEGGLEIPIVYNCGGYENPEVIAVLNEIVDIYLPDMKYGENSSAVKFSGCSNYVQYNRDAIREMFHQAGPLRTDHDGIGKRGICIRHLVLPNGQSFSMEILDYLKSNYDISDIHISLMAQYNPMYKADRFPEINRPLQVDEYENVKNAFFNEGFEGFYQDISQIDE
ncbi:MAG: hypothetical protein Q4F84_05290, partial [Fibrobacter sp.]|nr:hypothetical protein [Fibrobacter sp.]